MIATVYIHSIDKPLAKEVDSCEQLFEWLDEIDFDRIDKVILTDLRSITPKITKF